MDEEEPGKNGRRRARYGGRKERKAPAPLTRESLGELALSYAARFATTRAKLIDYLARKLRERGWGDEGLPDIEALADKLVDHRYVDDEAYARARAGSLLRRGYGARRIGQALHHAGVEERIREDVAPGEIAAREAVLAMARKRRFGPFAPGPVERDRREKQIAALLRAGHSFGHVRTLMDAKDEDAAELWARCED